MRLVLIAPFLLLATLPASAACDAWGDLGADGFKPEAATVGSLSAMVMLQSGMPLSEGQRVIVTSRPDDTFSCIVRVGPAPDFPAETGMVLTELLEPDNQRGGDWLGAWQAGIEQFITIEQSEDALDISGEATWGMFDPERVARGGVNSGSFVATARAKKGRIAFTQDYEGQTLPYDPDGEGCSVQLWLAGEFLVAADNYRCGGMNVSFTGFYARLPDN